MRDFSIENYNSFIEGGNKVTSNVQLLGEHLSSSKKCVEELCSEDVFAGPIANDFAQKFNIIETTLSKSVGELQKAELYLNRTNFNYQASDKTNASEIGGV